MGRKAGVGMVSMQKIVAYIFMGAFVFFILVFFSGDDNHFSNQVISSRKDRTLEIDFTDPILKKYLTPPSNLPYNLSATPDNSQAYRDIYNGYILSFFKNKTNGVFLEAGVNDGETMSHTLYLERTFNWSGMIVECNPALAPLVKSRNRKAWFASACLGSPNTPGRVNFSIPKTDLSKMEKTLFGSLGNQKGWNVVEVETVPLFSLLEAVKMFEIDYFSFDIEGAELDVLREFPFHLVRFKMIIMEVNKYKKSKLAELEQLLLQNGYEHVKKQKFPHDRLYVHESVKNQIP